MPEVHLWHSLLNLPCSMLLFWKSSKSKTGIRIGNHCSAFHVLALKILQVQNSYVNCHPSFGLPCSRFLLWNPYKSQNEYTNLHPSFGLPCSMFLQVQNWYANRRLFWLSPHQQLLPYVNIQKSSNETPWSPLLLLNLEDNIPTSDTYYRTGCVFPTNRSYIHMRVPSYTSTHTPKTLYVFIVHTHSRSRYISWFSTRPGSRTHANNIHQHSSSSCSIRKPLSYMILNVLHSHTGRLATFEFPHMIFLCIGIHIPYPFFLRDRSYMYHYYYRLFFVIIVIYNRYTHMYI